MVAAEEDRRMGREFATGLKRNWRGELGQRWEGKKGESSVKSK